ncbi:angiopoietin-related protein 2-like [Takifugu flavidus]|uniref:angiopoietin-related protein 2-like n=1 Tax=Takifugu flavidus TaxID=433684 RepID=UPI0025449EEF|nr:angiopoietin-related protein 2-like [Takifugu flavidus]
MLETTLLYPVFLPHQKFPFKLHEILSILHNHLITILVRVSFQSKRGCDVWRLLIYPLGIILRSPPPPPPPPPPLPPPPSCWITLEKFFVFGIVAQLGRQAEHGLGNGALGPWHDCQHVLDSGENTSGIYLLRPQGTNRLLQAWCEQSRAQGGWTVIQKRQDGSVNFFRTWEQYKLGFGNLDGEYWLGLEHLYWITKQAQYKLRVMLEDWQGRQVFAEYDSFSLEPESDWYRLCLGQYSGNAGDSLSWHNNKAFTTLDRDKDSYTGNCAHYQKGGWWYHMCAHSNLNGVWYRGGHYRSRYQDGVYWAEFHGGSYSLKRVSMMIKPT